MCRTCRPGAEKVVDNQDFHDDMNGFVKYFLKNRAVTWLLLVLVLAGGLFSYVHMGKLEDAPFTIKQALVLTPYPGASPAEVQEQVTDVLEESIQSLGELYYLKTENRAGMSKITVYVKKEIRADQMQQLWDKLRRKVSDVQSKLPAGAGPSVVNDDFGDVLGVFYGITGDGRTYRELEDQAKLLKNELLKVKDVARVEVYGMQTPTIDVTVRPSVLARGGLTTADIARAFAAQNKVVDAGAVETAENWLRIESTGNFYSLDDIRRMTITSQTGEHFRLAVYLLVDYGFLVVGKALVGARHPFAFSGGGVRILLVVWLVEVAVLGLLLSNRMMAQTLRLSQRAAELQAENNAARYAALQSQLNPHFLFNNLNALIADRVRSGSGRLLHAQSVGGLSLCVAGPKPTAGVAWRGVAVCRSLPLSARGAAGRLSPLPGRGDGRGTRVPCAAADPPVADRKRGQTQYHHGVAPHGDRRCDGRRLADGLRPDPAPAGGRLRRGRAAQPLEPLPHHAGPRDRGAPHVHKFHG